jgi:Zn-dependent peptidase ImmA (M78 family)
MRRKHRGYRIKVEIRQGGYISGHSIIFNSNLQESENTATLIHELAHGLLKHQSESNGNTPVKIKEQQAEVTTYLVCKTLGINRKSEFYLKTWRLSQDIAKDFKAIDRIFKAILKGLTDEQPKEGR